MIELSNLATHDLRRPAKLHFLKKNKYKHRIKVVICDPHCVDTVKIAAGNASVGVCSPACVLPSVMTAEGKSEALLVINQSIPGKFPPTPDYKV